MKTNIPTKIIGWHVSSEAYLEGMKTLYQTMEKKLTFLSEAYLEGMKTGRRNFHFVP